MIEKHIPKRTEGSSQRGGVTCWQETFRYVLPTYSTPSDMRVLDDLRTFKKKKMNFKNRTERD